MKLQLIEEPLQELHIGDFVFASPYEDAYEYEDLLEDGELDDWAAEWYIAKVVYLDATGCGEYEVMFERVFVEGQKRVEGEPEDYPRIAAIPMPIRYYDELCKTEEHSLCRAVMRHMKAIHRTQHLMEFNLEYYIDGAIGPLDFEAIAKEQYEKLISKTQNNE